jgi:hypothetical protein
MSPAEVAEMVRQQGPIDAMQRANMMQRAQDFPKPDTYKMEDFLYHPELYARFPEMRNKSVKVINDPGKTSRGWYQSKTGEIGLNTNALLKNPSEGGAPGVIGHEATHGLQADYDLPGGSNAGNYKMTSDLEQFLRDGLDNSRMGESPETIKHWENLLDKSHEEAWKRYLKAPGEQHARLAQERFSFSPDERQFYDPNKRLKELWDQPDPEFAYHLKSAAKSLMDAGRDPHEVPSILRSWGTIK